MVGEAVWVTRSVGKTATASFRVAVVSGRPAIVECRVLAAGGPDGLDAITLRAAVTTGGVIDAAEPLLAADPSTAWGHLLRDAATSAPEEPGRELVLATIGYVAAVDAGSRRPVVEVAQAMGISRRRVQRHIELARERSLLAPPTESRPTRGHWRGIAGGHLTPLGDAEFGVVLARRLGVHPGGLVSSTIGDAPGTAARLLAFLGEEPPDGPLRDSAAVVIDAKGVRDLSPDEFLGPAMILPDGSSVRVRRR
jgi:hypothetical protein